MCRADKHMPLYAKKLVAMYNQNGEIDQMLSRKWSYYTQKSMHEDSVSDCDSVILLLHDECNSDRIM